MDEKHAASKDAGGEIQNLLQKAKDAAEEVKAAPMKVPGVPGEKGVAGRKKYPTETEPEQEPAKDEEDDEMAEVKEELNSILKKAPGMFLLELGCTGASSM